MKNIRLHMFPNFDQKLANLIHEMLDSIKVDYKDSCELIHIDENYGDNCKYYKVSDEHAAIIEGIINRIREVEKEEYEKGVHAGSNLLLQLNNGDITPNDFIGRTGRESLKQS